MHDLVEKWRKSDVKDVEGGLLTSIQALLAAHGIECSMSRRGNCYDNAVHESFFGTLKSECADVRFASRTAARQCVFEYIEVWYNRQRRHSTLGYLSPAEFEQVRAVS